MTVLFGFAAALFALALAGSASATIPVPNAGGPYSGDEDGSISFSGSFVDPDLDTWTQGWNILNETSDGASVSFTFATPASYTVTYWVNDGTSNVSATASVTVFDITSPSANAGSDQSVNEDTVVTLSGSSTTDNDPNFGTNGRYYWTFNDNGVSVTRTGVSPTYTFATPGTYSVSLIVLDYAGNFASDIVVITVRDITAPTGAGSVPASAAEDTSVAFSSAAITDNDPNFASTRRDYWTLTDGSLQNHSGASASHTFNTPGTYSITLTVMDSAGNTLTSAFSILIIDTTAPTGSGSVPASANEDASASFSSAAITDNDPTFSTNRRDYWTFTDGSVQNLSGTSVSYTFATPGSYPILLTVMDITGNKLTASFTLVVRDITAPTGSGSVPTNANEDTVVSLDSTAITDNDPNFAAGTYPPGRRDFWTFTAGGSQNLSGSSRTFTFATPGTYVINLLVMDAAGNRLSASFTLVIADVTPPTVTIAAGSSGQSRQQFSTMTHSGSATDNVAVSGYWWVFTDVTAQNMSGTSFTRSWPNTGAYTITFFARDAAWNIGSASTTFTVTPDVTLPTVTFTSAPLTGDDQTPLTYTATATDNDPSCSTTCNWTWSQDGVQFAWGVTSVVVTWSPGQHTITLAVRDQNGNPRTVSPAVINIDQLVMADLLWDTQSVTMNWNLRIVNGATFLIRDSTVWNSSNGVTVSITVVSGRLILENSQMVSTSSTYGFRISATGVNGGGSYLYFNRSSVSGLFDWITVNNATLSATDATFDSVRLASAGVILGTNANLYLTNVTLDTTAVTTTNGIRATYTNIMTLLQRREVVIERLDARAVARTPFAFNANGVTGTVDVTLRDSTLRSVNAVSGVRGIDIVVQSSTGVLNFNIRNVDAQSNIFGGLNAVHQTFTGTVAYTIVDSTFSGASSGNGMLFQFTSTSSSAFGFTFQNVTSENSSQTGITFRFESSGWNQGSISMSQMMLSNNNLDGLYFLLSNSRITADISIQDATMFNDGRNGLFFDTTLAARSNITLALDRVTLTSARTQRGFTLNMQRSNYNFSISATDTVMDTNQQDGFYFYHYNTDTSKGTERGDQVFNFTRVSMSNNLQNGMQIYTYNTNENISGWWADVTIDNNRQRGIYGYAYLYYNYFRNPGSPVTYGPGERNITIHADRVSISRNGADGIYAYDNYAYGYFTYACNPGCNYYQFSISTLWDLDFNNSHIDGNGGKGVYWYGYYGFYSAMIWHLTMRDSTVNDNAASGLYAYGYYLYSYAWLFQGVGRSASDVVVNVDNSTVDRNGLRGSDNYGVYTYAYYFLGSGQMLTNVTDSSVSDNGGTGVYFYLNQAQYSQSTNVHIEGSRINNNGGRGIESNYYYVYEQTVDFYVNGTQLISNGAEGIVIGYPESYGRYYTGFTFRITNSVFDDIPSSAITTEVTYSCQGCGNYGGPDSFNFSGNRITNTGGAAMAFGFDAPGDSQTISVTIRDNYVADVEDGLTISIPGSSNTQHTWVVVNNTVERSNGNAMLLAMDNFGGGNTGSLIFESNVFRNTGGTAFTLIQSSIKMTTLNIKDCVFDTQRTGIQLSGILGIIDNATFIASVKDDVVLTDGMIDIHNTDVDPAKLKPVGSGSAFNVWFHLKVYVVWAGTGKTVVGAVAQYADATGNIFFVDTVADADGLPELELWSYTKSLQGVLGRTPFRVDVTYFEIEQRNSIDLYTDRVVTIELRDNVLPTVVISNPEDGFGTQGTTIQLDGTTYDSQSGFVFDINDPQLPAQYVEVSTDGVTWMNAHVKSSSAFEVAFDYTFTGLTEDVDALYVRVHDDALNFVTRVIPVRVDRTAPIVTILSPVATDIVTNGASVSLSAETEVGTLIYINGLTPPEVFTRPDNIHVYFTMDIPVFEGPNTITVVAIDGLDNQGSASRFVLVDRQPPYLAVLEPDVDALVNSTSITVKGQTERSGVAVTVNGADAPVDSAGNFSATVTLASDFNRVEILATDTAGNTQLVVREVRFDNVAPWINVQAPSNNALLRSPEVDVVGIVEPGARLIVNDEVVSAPTGAFSRRVLLTEGANAIQFVGVDPAGNYGYRTVFVTVDTVRPVLNVLTPANESLVNTQSVLLTGDVADDHGRTLFVNGQEVAVNTDGTFSLSVEMFEGTNFLTVEALDGAGNRVTRVLTVVSDTTAPYVLPEFEGTFVEGVQVKTYDSTVTVTGFAEKGSIVEVCSKATGANLSASAEVCNAIPLAADGGFRTFVELQVGATTTVTVTATDAAGNTATRPLSVSRIERPVVAPEPVNAGLIGLYGLGAALLGGAFFLLYMRRGKGGQPAELAGAGMMPYAPSGPMDIPPPEMGGEVGVPSGEVQAEAAPEVSGEVEVTSAPEVEEAAATLEENAELGGAVPEAASRSRPMRRRPLGGGEGGAEGGSLTGMGAEEEAVPGESHQDEQKEG